MEKFVFDSNETIDRATQHQENPSYGE
jgi:hypothetical protein